MKLLSQLTQFVVEDNPLRSPPYDTALCGTQHIIAFLNGAPLPVEGRSVTRGSTGGLSASSSAGLAKPADNKPVLERSKGIKSFKESSNGGGPSETASTPSPDTISSTKSGHLSSKDSRSSQNQASGRPSTPSASKQPSTNDAWNRLKKQTINDFFLLENDKKFIKKRHETDHLAALLYRAQVMTETR